MTDAELAGLKSRVDAMERVLNGVRDLLTEYRAAKQTTLLPDAPDHPAVVDSVALVTMRKELLSTFERATGRKYLFDGAKDAQAVKRLVRLGLPIEDVVSRWDEALTAKFRGAQSIAQFASRINEYGKKTTVAPAVPVKEDPYGS